MRVYITFAGLSDASLKDERHGVRHNHGGSAKNKFTGLYTGPYFDPAGNPDNVTVQLGDTALLPCRIKQLGKQTVRISNIIKFLRLKTLLVLRGKC